MRADRLALVGACLVVLVVSLGAAADREYQVRGMVLEVDPAARTMLVSHDAIPGFMEAMAMPFEVRDAAELKGLVPGALVRFTLVVGSEAAYTRGVDVRRYQSVERDPQAARRLELLRRLTAGAAAAVAVGQLVPDFTLLDQRRRPLSLASLGGKVVALNFVYTRCPLPQFCLRMSNTFSALQKQFAGRLGRDLVLVTVTLDPRRDQPDVLARYAEQFGARPDGWRFLTGSVADVRRVTDLFGVSAFPEEGLLNHSLRTAVIDRDRRLVANIEGNEYTPKQLEALLELTLGSRR